MTEDTSTILVVGGTGATGKLLVMQLLEQGHRVKVVARAPDRLPESVRTHEHAVVIEGNVLDMSSTELAAHTQGCDAIASCLGHSLSWRGIFGPPRRLVALSVSRLCQAVQSNAPAHPVRFVLMSSTGCMNSDAKERVSLAHRVVIGAIRILIPPHADNEAAISFLRTKVSNENPAIEWVIVRPDTLTNEDAVSPYNIHTSPIRSALFNSGKTSRINAAHFMSELATDSSTWSRWVGQMPVVYNDEAQ